MKTSISDLALQRPTWAEINLDFLRSNFVEIQTMAAPAGVMAVVKSDAYGHGATYVAQELASAGASFFGVATAAEATGLRAAGIQTPILVLSGMTPQQLPLLLHREFTPAVYAREFFRELIRFAAINRRPLKVHLKIDTGMGRLGLDPHEAAALLQEDHPYVQIDGLFTHFACADVMDDEFTRVQIRKFTEFVDRHRKGISFVHAANSAGLLNYPESRYDLVRPGLLLYGISPVSHESNFKPVLSLKSKIVFLNRVQQGESIGYGRTFVAKRESLIATVPFGYADGLRRALSNQVRVEVCGTLCPVVGTISMDLSMIDVTDVQNRVQLYDTVTFVGPRTTVWNWADLLNTIPYEITCLIGARVPRVYYKNNEIHDVYYP